MRRAPVLFASLVAIAAASSLSPSSASAGGGAHPCFNDRGTIPWYRSLSDAQAAARTSGKLIFIESGRLECSQCRRLVAGILPYEPIRSRMSAAAIGFADDCDESDPAVRRLFDANLPGATMLPLVGFVTPDLRWVTGWYGGTMVGNVEDQLAIAEGAQRQLLPARAVESPRPATCATPAPVRAPTPVAQMPAPTPAPTPAPIARAPSTPTPHPTVAPPPPTPAPTIARGTSTPVPTPAAGGIPPARLTPPSPPPFIGSPTIPSVPSNPSIPSTPSVAMSSPAVTPPAVTPPVKSPPANSPPTMSPPVMSPPVMSPPVIARSAVPPVPAAAPPKPALGPVMPPATRAATPIERARAAAARESWGEVLRIADRDGPTGDSPEATEMSGLLDRACAWTLRTMTEAERAASDHRTADARKTLERMRRELEGTESPALVDADRGLRAVGALAAIEGGSPDGAETTETIRRRAYAEFRGSRWAPLFRSR